MFSYFTVLLSLFIVLGGNIIGQAPNTQTRYDAAGIILDDEDVEWSTSTLTNDRINGKHVSNFGMDAMKTDDEIMVNKSNFIKMGLI